MTGNMSDDKFVQHMTEKIKRLAVYEQYRHYGQCNALTMSLFSQALDSIMAELLIDCGVASISLN